MAYKRMTYRFKNSIEIEEYHDGNYGAPGEARRKKKKATKEEIRYRNRINKEKRVRHKIKGNFGENDYFATLTYAKEKRPQTIAAAVKEFAKFIRTVSREYKNRGHTVKWMRTIEIGSRGGVHVHMIVNRIPDTDIILKKAWDYGGIHTTLLYEKGDFKDLASYMVKETEDEDKIRGSSYSCSRNLKNVKPEKDIVRGKDLDEEPRPRKNFYLDKESVVEGINPVTGYRYRHYTYIRIHRRI